MGFSCDELASKLNSQSDYELQIRQYMDEKRRLYERLVLGEIDDVVYQEQKSVCDAKLAGVKGRYSDLSTQTARMQSDKAKISELQSVAKNIVGEKCLTRELVEAFFCAIYTKIPHSRFCSGMGGLVVSTSSYLPGSSPTEYCRRR